MKVKELIEQLQEHHKPEDELCCSIWGVEDILGLDEDLTEEDAKEVIRRADHYHDAEIGINWDVLGTHIDIYKSEKK
jgi:hypothetical protein